MMAVSGELFPPDAPALTLGAGATGQDAPADTAQRLGLLYAEHFEFVWRSARRLGVPLHAVDDAVQDVFLVAQRKLAEFEGRSSQKTWLFGILRKVARDHRPGAGRATAETVDLDALPGTERGPLIEAERAQSARLLQALLSELDDDRREAFILVDLEELSVPEAAEALAVNVNTLYSRVRAARQDLSKALARRRATSERSEPWSR